MTPTPQYWDEVANQWQSAEYERAWRVVSDAVNLALINHWAPDPTGCILKTDLFDEVVSAGLVPRLQETWEHVTGIDISPVVVKKVRGRFPRLDAHVADVRQLPFAVESFDTIISNSTLDHFPREADIALAMEELHRVLRRHGTLIVTLDNPLNPIIAVRNALPDGFRRATGMVPFAVGATCGPRELRVMLERAGFEVNEVGAIFHAPRALVVLGGHAIDRFDSSAARRRYTRFWTAFESLGKLPSRFFTGHFVAALASKK
jgi:SAM-dependent methyltransferase